MTNDEERGCKVPKNLDLPLPRLGHAFIHTTVESGDVPFT
jgi:hypothetical protein